MGLFQLQPITEAEENVIYEVISCANFNQTKKLSFILFFANFIFLFIDYNNKVKGLWAINEAYCYVFYTHVVLGLVTLMFILISYRVLVYYANKITSINKLYVNVFAFFILNYSAIISGWVSQNINRPSTVYIIACFTVAVMFNFKPKSVALLYGFSCVTFMISLTISQEDPYMSIGYYMDAFLLVLISYFLSTVLYEFKQQNLRYNYYLEDLVVERTKELQAANNLLTMEITERQRTEIEMVRLEKLNLIGEMAASISHEVRNPMTTVKGFLQLLKDKQESRDREYFEIMIEELDRANSILSEFLSITRNKPTIIGIAQY